MKLFNLCANKLSLSLCAQELRTNCFFKQSGHFYNVLSCYWIFPQVNVSFMLFFEIRAIRKSSLHRKYMSEPYILYDVVHMTKPGFYIMRSWVVLMVWIWIEITYEHQVIPLHPCSCHVWRKVFHQPIQLFQHKRFNKRWLFAYLTVFAFGTYLSKVRISANLGRSHRACVVCRQLRDAKLAFANQQAFSHLAQVSLHYGNFEESWSYQKTTFDNSPGIHKVSARKNVRLRRLPAQLEGTQFGNYDWAIPGFCKSWWGWIMGFGCTKNACLYIRKIPCWRCFDTFRLFIAVQI